MTKDKGMDRIPDAYDADGRPLFYHPPEESSLAPEFNDDPPRVEKVEPGELDGSIEKVKHDRSVSDYPNLDLDPNEYVIIDVQRQMLALALIWAVEFALALLLIVVWFMVMFSSIEGFASSEEIARSYITVIVALALGVLLAAGFVSGYVFKNNKYIVTNKRVIQLIVSGLFYRKRQEIKLRMVEDVSFNQSGVLQYMFNFGTIRLAAIGDDSNYTYSYVKNPETQVREISKLVNQIQPSTPEKTDDN
jgi:hypothetical protein